MSYLMEIQQGETINIVGIFATLENADNFSIGATKHTSKRKGEKLRGFSAYDE